MNRHVAMDPFTTTWWICILTVVTIITTIILLPKYFNWASNKNYPKILAGVLLANLIIENIYSYSTDKWSIQYSLPLHMCGMSVLMSILVLFKYNTKIAHLVFYWGLTGGIYSLLTPEFDQGDQGFFFYSYFIGHGGLILTCLYLIIHNKFRPETNSWLRIFIYTQFAAVAVGTFNWVTGSNYMYLITPPEVNNPLIIGNWPWYILFFEALAIVHFYLFYRLSRVWK
jgi:hypothetical integral membrane protein (TIGR02206 family)